MKKLFWIISVALLAITACHREAPDNDPVGIAMIVKNGQIDYFRQIETSFREICQEKGLEAYYYSTSSETAYQEQLTAVTELRKLGKSALKGIIFAPSYGINGENAEAEVAALAQERGIPVIIIDSPVKTNGPLASSPYIGTDNTAAGEAMAKLLSADNVAVFAMINSPGIERATAFKALKPEADVYRVGEKCIDEVKAVLDKYNDFVFFNGNDLIDVLPNLVAAGKRVYTFDVYGEFLDLLIAGSPCLKGVMAQNTFAMARKAVEAVLAANGKPGEMVPTFFLTTATLDAEEAQPFLEFYGRQIPDLNVAENIIGKWMPMEQDGSPVVTNRKEVLTFASASKAYISASLSKTPEGGSRWDQQMEADVTINGNKVTLTSHPEANATMMQEYTIVSISATQFTANHTLTTTVNGEVVISIEDVLSYAKVPIDYSEAILGFWECTELSGIETYNDANARLEFLADGTYRYYRMNDNGQWEEVTAREIQDYFVDGSLLATRWKDADGEELREWWEIASIADGNMNWFALRQQEQGATVMQTMKWKKIDLNLAENIIGKWMTATSMEGQPALTNDKEVVTFVSSSKAYVSRSRGDMHGGFQPSESQDMPAPMPGGGGWDVHQECDVTIDGNTVILTSEGPDGSKNTLKYHITSISESEFIGDVIREAPGGGTPPEGDNPGEAGGNTRIGQRYEKVYENYSGAIVGLWEGRCTSGDSDYDDGQVHRWAYMDDGTYVYYVKDGETWVAGEDTLNEYFVDGKLLCSRWVQNDVEYREWWEITIDDDKMSWTALRQKEDGSTYTVTFEMTLVPGIALIAKNGQIEYWRQIETAFRRICLDKGYNAYYCSTSADNAYFEQIAAVEELSRNGKDALKGIIFAPCYGPDGQSAEEEVAALAQERGIPVIILDSPATATGPLASCPFIGTDNTAAGKALAENVKADKVVAFAKVNTPGVERAQAFMTVKPGTELITVSESAASEVEAALSGYDDFVFFNGSNLVGVLATLKNAGKRVYTFDIYEDFLDELIAGDSCLQGIMAQNTFAMARRAVDAVLADSKEGQFVPTLYITISNITSPDVVPYLLYYSKG